MRSYVQPPSRHHQILSACNKHLPGSAAVLFPLYVRQPLDVSIASYSATATIRRRVATSIHVRGTYAYCTFAWVVYFLLALPCHGSCAFLRVVFVHVCLLLLA